MLAPKKPAVVSSFASLDLPSNFNRQVRFGKPVTNAERSMTGSICLFENRTNPIRRLHLVVSPKGTVSIHQIVMLNMHSPRSAANRMYQPVALSHSMDSNAYISKPQNRAESVFFDDSNYQIMSRFLSFNEATQRHSEYNALIVDAAIAEDYIPVSSATWDSRRDNMHVLVAYGEIKKLLQRTNTTSESKDRTLTAIFNAYDAAEQALINDGKLVSSHILIAKPSGIQPIIALSQNTNSASADFNAEKIFSHPSSEASYAPVMNKFHGFVLPDPNISQDPLTDATFGYGPIARQTQRSGNTGMNAEQSAASVLAGDIDSTNSADTSSTGRQRFTVVAQAYDFLNRSLEQGVILSMEDSFGTNLRGQIMSNYVTKNNGLIFIDNAVLSLIYHKDAQGARSNACTFIFGGNFSYQGHKDPNRQSVTVDSVPNLTADVPVQNVVDNSSDDLGDEFLKMLEQDLAGDYSQPEPAVQVLNTAVETVANDLDDRM